MSNLKTLSDYINILLTDALDGIIASESNNLEKINEIKQSSFLNDVEFAEKFISDDDIRQQILFMFPTNKLNVSAIDEGQSYQIPNEKQAEFPLILQQLSYIMTKEDYAIKDNITLITSIGYKHLFEAAKSKFTLEKRAIIKQLIYRGIPNIHINQGEISSPFTVGDFIIDDTLNQYEQGIRYKCYKSDTTDELLNIGKIPFKEGIANNFYTMLSQYSEANIIVFDGLLQIDSDDKYTFYLSTNGNCIIDINNKELLSTSLKNIRNSIYLTKGYHSLRVVCDILSLKLGLSLNYIPAKVNKVQKLYSEMLYYLVERKATKPFLYNNKQGELDISISGNSNPNIGHVKLSYTIDKE